MKNFVVFLLFSLSMVGVNYGQALSEARNPIDAPFVNCGLSNIQVVYDHTIIDPVVQETKYLKEILVIGDTVSIFQNLGMFELNAAIDSIGQGNLTLAEYMALSKKYRRGGSLSDFLVKNSVSHKILEMGFIDINRIYYYEPLPTMNWHLDSVTDSVCGYLCSRASTHFRGRNWIVWYAKDLKYQNGPWKLGGLPGLILRAQSEDGDHVFEAKSISCTPYKILHTDTKPFQQTTRDKFYKARKRFKTNPSQSMSAGLIRRADGMPVEMKRRFYNPEEKDN